MDRTQKQAFVGDLNQVFRSANVVVVTHYAGLNVAEVSDLRRAMRDVGAQFRVTKNRLTRLALRDTPYAALDELFTGPTAIAVSADPVAAPKAVSAFAKRNQKLVIVGGAMGAEVLSAAQVEALASLPSLDELRAKLAGLVAQPAANLARIIQAPAAQLARVLNAYAEKGGA